MRDSRRAAPGPADADGVRHAVVAVAAAVLCLLPAIVTLVSAPGTVGDRLLLVGVYGVCLAMFAVIGLVLIARWRHEDRARTQ
ncbi:hypothetical protein [Nocardia sp. NBC_01388]|uniref:hypothetical protein n=1 Tax=Nocardia sp. NBC_01388 TaxID=2903596 RepID=UPI0032554F18